MQCADVPRKNIGWFLSVFDPSSCTAQQPHETAWKFGLISILWSLEEFWIRVSELQTSNLFRVIDCEFEADQYTSDTFSMARKCDRLFIFDEKCGMCRLLKNSNFLQWTSKSTHRQTENGIREDQVRNKFISIQVVPSISDVLVRGRFVLHWYSAWTE